MSERDPDARTRRLAELRASPGVANGNGGVGVGGSDSSAMRRSLGRRPPEDDTTDTADAEDENGDDEDGDDEEEEDEERFEVDDGDGEAQDMLDDAPESPLTRAHSPPAPAQPEQADRADELMADELMADAADTPTVSGEDDDYRSETSSEMSSSRGSRPRQQITAACADHGDLSARLRRAVYGGADAVGFDETLVGADVVLCVRRRRRERRPRPLRHSDSDEEDEDDEGHKPESSPGSRSPIVPEIQKFHAHRFMLAASSAPFRAMLTGSMRESSEREVEIHGIAAPVVEKMLLFIYTGEVVLDLENVVGLLIASEMYELDALREMCKGFVLNHAHEVFRDPQIVQIPEKLLLEIIQQDELQIRELALMEALVMWGEARVTNGDKTTLGKLLNELMECVRFSTMSVSDLYGKVRPLVKDGVIREALLTEALFHHLKWGSQSGPASKRNKPRQLTASLRKRKRVSFIQHVSFVPT